MTASLRLDPRRFVRDTLAGLIVFAIAMLAIIGASSPAGVVEANVLAFAGQSWLPFLLLAVMFSTLLAFNLALYRHVRQRWVRQAALRNKSTYPDQA